MLDWIGWMDGWVILYRCDTKSIARAMLNKSYFFFNFSHVGYRLQRVGQKWGKEVNVGSMSDTNLHIPDVVNVQGFLKADHQTLKKKTIRFWN